MSLEAVPCVLRRGENGNVIGFLIRPAGAAQSAATAVGGHSAAAFPPPVAAAAPPPPTALPTNCTAATDAGGVDGGCRQTSAVFTLASGAAATVPDNNTLFIQTVPSSSNVQVKTKPAAIRPRGDRPIQPKPVGSAARQNAAAASSTSTSTSASTSASTSTSTVDNGNNNIGGTVNRTAARRPAAARPRKPKGGDVRLLPAATADCSAAANDGLPSIIDNTSQHFINSCSLGGSASMQQQHAHQSNYDYNTHQNGASELSQLLEDIPSSDLVRLLAESESVLGADSGGKAAPGGTTVVEASGYQQHYAAATGCDTLRDQLLGTAAGHQLNVDTLVDRPSCQYAQGDSSHAGAQPRQQHNDVGYAQRQAADAALQQQQQQMHISVPPSPQQRFGQYQQQQSTSRQQFGMGLTSVGTPDSGVHSVAGSPQTCSSSAQQHVQHHGQPQQQQHQQQFGAPPGLMSPGLKAPCGTQISPSCSSSAGSVPPPPMRYDGYAAAASTSCAPVPTPLAVESRYEPISDAESINLPPMPCQPDGQQLQQQQSNAADERPTSSSSTATGIIEETAPTLAQHFETSQTAGRSKRKRKRLKKKRVKVPAGGDFTDMPKLTPICSSNDEISEQEIDTRSKTRSDGRRSSSERFESVCKEVLAGKSNTTPPPAESHSSTTVAAGTAATAATCNLDPCQDPGTLVASLISTMNPDQLKQLSHLLKDKIKEKSTTTPCGGAAAEKRNEESIDGKGEKCTENFEDDLNNESENVDKNEQRPSTSEENSFAYTCDQSELADKLRKYRNCAQRVISTNLKSVIDSTLPEHIAQKCRISTETPSEVQSTSKTARNVFQQLNLAEIVQRVKERCKERQLREEKCKEKRQISNVKYGKTPPLKLKVKPPKLDRQPTKSSDQKISVKINLHQIESRQLLQPHIELAELSPRALSKHIANKMMQSSTSKAPPIEEPPPSNTCAAAPKLTWSLRRCSDCGVWSRGKRRTSTCNKCARAQRRRQAHLASRHGDKSAAQTTFSAALVDRAAVRRAVFKAGLPGHFRLPFELRMRLNCKRKRTLPRWRNDLHRTECIVARRWHMPSTERGCPSPVPAVDRRWPFLLRHSRRRASADTAAKSRLQSAAAAAAESLPCAAGAAHKSPAGDALLSSDADLSYMDEGPPLGTEPSLDGDAPDGRLWRVGGGGKADSEDQVRCVCGSYDDDGEMAQCDKCLYWLHAECLHAVGCGAASGANAYVCPVCRRRLERPPKVDVRLQPQPEYRLPGCSYYRALLVSDEHKNKLRRLHERCVAPAAGDKDARPPAATSNGDTKKAERESPGADVIHRRHLRIFRVERLFTAPDGERFVFGVYYARPHETFAGRGRKFHKKELFCTPMYDTLPLALVVGRCLVLEGAPYSSGRPRAPRYPEADVYVCDTRVDKQQRSFERLNAKTKYFVNTQPYAFERFPEKMPLKRDFTPFLLRPASAGSTTPNKKSPSSGRATKRHKNSDKSSAAAANSAAATAVAASPAKKPRLNCVIDRLKESRENEIVKKV